MKSKKKISVEKRYIYIYKKTNKDQYQLRLIFQTHDSDHEIGIIPR